MKDVENRTKLWVDPFMLKHYMKTKAIRIRTAICVVVSAIGAPLCVSSVPAEEALQIDKAYLGASGSWRDVTAFLRSQVTNDALAVDISQPFERIGGDPSPGKPKNLMIDYRFHGQSLRLLLEERYPVAFQISLPSAEAEPPGKDPKASAMLEEIKAAAVPIAGTQGVRAQQEPGKVSGSLLGTWELASYKYGTNQPGFSQQPPSERRIKLITEGHFTWVSFDPANKKVQAVAGGAYSLKGKAYTESIDWADSSMESYLGNRQAFTIRVEGDKLFLSGALSDGLKIEEVWHRVKQ